MFVCQVETTSQQSQPSLCLLYRSNLTTQKARDSRDRTQRVAAASQNTNNNTVRVNSDVKEQMVLYSKLFVVMGIAWIFEYVHYVIHSDHTHTQQHCYDTLEIVLRAISCFNLLRGSLIFFIFVCKDSILDKVKAATQDNRPDHSTILLPGIKTDRLRSQANIPPEETPPTFRQRHQQGVSALCLSWSFNVVFFTGN